MMASIAKPPDARIATVNYATNVLCRKRQTLDDGEAIERNLPDFH
jgi:hypothetical protein